MNLCDLCAIGEFLRGVSLGKTSWEEWTDIGSKRLKQILTRNDISIKILNNVNETLKCI